MKTLRFEIDTDASYTPAEIEELQEAWVSWMTDVDPDADADTADVKIVVPSSVPTDEKSEIIEEFLASGNFEADIRIRAKGYANDGRFASGIVSLENE